MKESLHPLELGVKEIVTAYVERHAPSSLWLAYSGGLDSSVLLHICHRLGPYFPKTSVKAIHVHHGLLPQADAWTEHCRRQCEERQIPLVLRYVDASRQSGESPEAIARRLRYQAIEQEMEADDFLLLAHHQDDQAETLLLQLMRGAGVKGLSGMSEFSQWNRLFKLRPLLDISRVELLKYAKNSGLDWVEDPSNLSLDYDRNYLRHKVLPALKNHWPSATRVIGRSASLCAEADGLNEELAAIDLAELDPRDDSLDIRASMALASSRIRNVLRYWIALGGWPAPGYQALQRIETELLPAKEDAQPLVEWQGITARRYRDRLFIVPDLAPLPQLSLPWDMSREMPIEGLGRLKASRVNGAGIDLKKLHGRTLEVGFRQGGESLRPSGDQYSRPLQKLMQSAGIPPWQRGRMPLLFDGKNLVAVVGHWIASEYAVAPGEEGVEIELITVCPS